MSDRTRSHFASTRVLISTVKVPADGNRSGLLHVFEGVTNTPGDSCSQIFSSFDENLLFPSESHVYLLVASCSEVGTRFRFL